jgi:hypothetical protein
MQIIENARRPNRERRLQMLQEIAHSKGGVCLSDEYLGVAHKLLWQCAAEHRWQATPFTILRGSWCPQCYYQSLRLGIEHLRAEAAKRGGKCLSADYDTVEQELEWQCAKGHVWRAKASHVLEGTWCPHCARDAMRLGIEKMRQFAWSREGECLSDTYVNSGMPLLWRCASGHEFSMSYDNANAGHWCPTCAKAARNAKRLQLMREIAIERGGLCLSDNYVGSRQKLLWQCDKGHTWHAMPVMVKSGTWCPECAWLNLCKSDESRAKYRASRFSIQIETTP